MKTFIELLYSVCIGIAVALFIGLGVWALYPGPEAPTYPAASYNYSANSYTAEESEEEARKYREQQDAYNDKMTKYSLNVALITLVPAVLFFAVGLTQIKKNDVVSEGLAIGGIFTVLYALTRAGFGISTENNKRYVIFISVTILLAMIIILAKKKFQEDAKPAKSRNA